jgi:hypothetical protein
MAGLLVCASSVTTGLVGSKFHQNHRCQGTTPRQGRSSGQSKLSFVDTCGELAEADARADETGDPGLPPDRPAGGRFVSRQFWPESLVVSSLIRSIHGWLAELTSRATLCSGGRAGGAAFPSSIAAAASPAAATAAKCAARPRAGKVREGLGASTTPAIPTRAGKLTALKKPTDVSGVPELAWGITAYRSRQVD